MDIREDIVYEVIQSMADKEEKFFVKSARKNTFYFTLYTLIKKKEIYDSKELAKELEKSGCKQPLYKLKSYLKAELLQSIIRYNKENNEIDILQQLSEVKILMLKGLYSEALKVLFTLKISIIEKGLFHFIPTIYSMNYKLGMLKKDTDPNVFVEYRQHFEENLINYKLDYLYYYIKEIHLRKFSIKEDLELRSTVENVLDDPVMIENNSSESTLIKIKRYNIFSLYYLMVSDLDESLKNAFKAIDLLNIYPGAEYYSDIKIPLVRNVILFLSNLKRKDLIEKEAHKFIHELTDLSKSNYNALAVLFQIQNMQMICSNDFSNLELNTKKFLKKQRLFSIDFRAILLMGFSLVYMKKGDYDNALDWIEKATSFCKKHELPYRLLGARVISYWIHFKLGNYRILDSVHLSIKRQMEKYEISSNSYDFLVKYSRKYIQAYDITEQIPILEKWKQDFDNLEFTDKMHFDTIYFSFFDNLEEMIKSHKESKAVKSIR
ncbi:MAG: hypothetical protein EA412_12090 [Chitinophagaceae bacterium]|nr:MAG: hypothetical protein EA412_12090 [Chitinophagaceae bacterium]